LPFFRLWSDHGCDLCRKLLSLNIEYVITDSESSVPNDRVRAFALCEGWFGYDRKKYAAMLREAFEPFVQCAPKAVDIKCLNEPFSEEELKRFPLCASCAPPLLKQDFLV